ncbi:undecaprenyl-diphosphate phosphatase [Solimonas marina]|uniref:Undecaprenyl-diphosphatase n=1 Tax=Solimonas marina TaxID=2714601 RepID=A0A969W7C9_9GAMM|nr:undecaprenyl-diphosphate phosphatase [Solimonas marina]
MDSIINTILLGIIEGITEFLPISSTGHLLIAEHWLGYRSDLFNVGIQAGAMLAVVLIYRQRLWDLTVGFNKSADNRDYFFKLSAAFLITCVGGLIAEKAGLKLPETVAPIAWALIIGGLAILVIEWHAKGMSPSTVVTWKIAIVVGLAQILAAVFPGTSRSASTIFAAMLVGLTSRPAATEFAFLVGIPTMFAATGYEMLKLLKSNAFAQEDWTQFTIGFVVSAIVAFIAVKWLLRYVQSHRFTLFAWYRIIFGAALLLLLPT